MATSMGVRQRNDDKSSAHQRSSPVILSVQKHLCHDHAKNRPIERAITPARKVRVVERRLNGVEFQNCRLTGLTPTPRPVHYRSPVKETVPN